MALNEVFDPADHLSLVCSDPTTPASGAPVRYGELTGIALTDEDSDGLTTVELGLVVYDLSVKGINDGGNSAVAAGDAIFYVDADTPKLSKKSSGYFFGFALEAVVSAATTTIRVLHVPSPGAGTLGSGTVGTTNLAALAVTTAKIAANNVTAAKLTSTLRTGFMQLSLVAAREITTNDIVNTAGDAGALSSNSTPKLYRKNGATDKKLVIEWAASNNDEIAWDITYPPDLDDTAAITVNLLVVMGGATDTPVLGVSYFEGIGDSNAGGNTAALGAVLAQKTVTIAAGDVGAYPTGASIGIVPAAHTTDAIQLIAAWIEYTRK